MSHKDPGSPLDDIDKFNDWWVAAVAGMAIPAVYVYIGGFQSSLLSDVLQTVLFWVLLIFTLYTIYSKVGQLSIRPSLPGAWFLGIRRHSSEMRVELLTDRRLRCAQGLRKGRAQVLQPGLL